MCGGVAPVRGDRGAQRRMRGQHPMVAMPLVMVAMNLVYAASAYPFGKRSDRRSHKVLLALGLAMLIAADLVLATNNHWTALLVGPAICGIALIALIK